MKIRLFLFFEEDTDKIFNEYLINSEINNFTKILNSLSDGVYITDGNSRTIFVNKSYERLSGTSRRLFLGKKMDQVVKEGLIDSAATCEVLKLKKEVTMNQVLNNNNEVVITSRPIFNKENKIIMVVTIVRDITEINKLKNRINANKKDINRLKYLMNEESNVVYRSDTMNILLKKAKKVAYYDVSVLITGETGVGKDVIAKYIHEVGRRKGKPFIEINCSAIPENLLESELFGYEPGAFTNALKKGKVGIFELANHGTIFLDEIGDLPIELQAKLLKVIQNKKIRKIGGTKDIPIDVRLISATNRNLKQMIKEETFREDLYYRINVIPIHIPPLRERREDIIPLIMYFLEQNKDINGENKWFAEDALNFLYNYNWPGNVRELKNLVERVYILSREGEIQQSELPNNIIDYGKDIDVFNINKYGTLDKAVSEFEKEIILDALGKISSQNEAAKLLGINASTFSRKIYRLGLKLQK